MKNTFSWKKVLVIACVSLAIAFGISLAFFFIGAGNDSIWNYILSH